MKVFYHGNNIDLMLEVESLHRRDLQRFTSFETSDDEEAEGGCLADYLKHASTCHGFCKDCLFYAHNFSQLCGYFDKLKQSIKRYVDAHPDEFKS